jgi:hypothetical protein
MFNFPKKRFQFKLKRIASFGDRACCNAKKIMVKIQWNYLCNAEKNWSNLKENSNQHAGLKHN